MLTNQLATLGSDVISAKPCAGPCAISNTCKIRRVPRSSVRSWSRHRTYCAQAVQADDTAQKSQQNFQHWWQKAGVKADALEPADFAGLRGMKASKAINTGDSIVSLPRTAALLVTPKMKCPFPELIDAAYWSKCQWFEKMALMLLHEQQKGQQSPVSGYVEQMPTDFDTLLHWSPEELQLLMYPHLIQQVQQQKQSWHEHYQNVQNASKGKSVSESDLVWALECVRSRAFSGPYSGPPVKQRAKIIVPLALAAFAYTQAVRLPLEQVLNGAIAAVLFNIIYDTLLSRKLRWFAMCPVIDSMNHQSTSTNEVAYEYFGDSFSVTADRKYQKGEQVFITYGQQSNDKLLQYYGFVEAKNPSDVFVVPSLLHALKELPYTDVPEERVRAVEQAGLMPALQQVALTKQGMPAKALQATRMLLASQQLHGQKSAADFEKPVDPMHEETCLQAVKDICMTLNNQLSRNTAKQSDVQISRQRQELAQAFRQQKSRVLQLCSKRLDDQIRKARKS